MLRKVKEALSNLTSICFICIKPLGKTFAKMRTCGDQMCEFSFKESNLGNIFNEIKKNPDISHFLVETTYMAFISGRAADLTEPFPSFLLRDREMRPETGNLEHIRVAQERGIQVQQAPSINKNNKNLELGVVFLKIIYSVIQEIDSIHSEVEFRQHIMTRTEHYFKNKWVKAALGSKSNVDLKTSQ